MTKQELEIRNKELEEINQNLYEKMELLLLDENKLKDLESRNKQLIQEVYDKGKVIKTLEQSIQEKDEVFKNINNKYNELANLFDEYIRSFDDNIEINRLFLRNVLKNQELMNEKIKKFNGSNEGGTEQ